MSYDEALENRFGYLRELSIKELEELKESLIQDTEYLLKVLDDQNASSEQKSEIKNSDLKFNREQLEYIEEVLKSKKSNKKM